jgi:hypothetical protein
MGMNRRPADNLWADHCLMEETRMRFFKAGLWFVVAMLVATGVASAQSTTGTISGRVIDDQHLPVPGVTVNAESPNLQGVRTAVTSENGDYLITLLPSGAYKISFELSGFQRQDRNVTLAPTQVLPVDVVMGPASVSETVEVVGRKADVLTQTAQVAINISQDLVSTLPTTRNLDAAVLLAPSVHPTGPSGAYSISGSMSFENLFLINGVTVNENVRGQAVDLYIEDAIQETTIATAGVSAEYGRFGGGVVNMITKSGGNNFSGSFRDTLNNDDWRTLTPYETDSITTDPTKKATITLDKVVPTYEYTFGGPVLKDRLWFFTAGRLQKQTSARELVQTRLPYIFTDDTQRFEGKGTLALTSNHRFIGGYTKNRRTQTNNTFNTALSMDLNSLETRKLPDDIFNINYSGVLRSNLFVEARVSERHETFIGSGAKSTDLIDGTLVTDQARGGLRYWAATFCGVCPPEHRDNQDIFTKGTYFLSTSGAGSHNMVFGFDSFNDIRNANNHQSGSDYRILGTTSIIQGAGTSNPTIYPVFLGTDNSTRIQWNPIPLASQGSNFRTYSLFYNDSWRVSGRITANVGVRWDKNSGKDQVGSLVAKDSAVSPRFGVIWDPLGDQRWSITGSFAQYVAALANSVADQSAGGNPQNQTFFYQGPSINADPNGPLTTTPVALQQVFDWFNTNGGAKRPFAAAPTFPGVSPKIKDSLKSPNVLEYAGGVNRQFGSRAALRADVNYRKFRDFYIQRIDLATGKVVNPAGTTLDQAFVQNDTDLLHREYIGLSAQGTYRFSSRVDIGGTYTLSHTWGNIEGETVGSGPTSFTGTQYPEYKQASWNYPDGDLSVDQRHRGRLWVNYGLPWVKNLTLSALQTLETGVPYGGSSGSGVNPLPFVTNPGYQTPPPGNQTTYFYTGRDAFRAVGQKRTDFAANYGYNVAMSSRTLNIFVQAQVINIFNQFQLCGCGGTVFVNGGAVTQTRIDQTVRTSVTNSALYRTFNPFTTTPIRGDNWDFGPDFGKALNRFAWTSPRQFRVSFGVRF